MHGHDGASLRRNSSVDLGYIDIACFWIGVHEYRSGARQPDRFCRREESVGRGDDLVAWAQTQGEKHQQQCIGARIDSHGLLQFHVAGELFFKLRQLWSEHVTPALQHVKDGLAKLCTPSEPFSLNSKI